MKQGTLEDQGNDAGNSECFKSYSKGFDDGRAVGFEEGYNRGFSDAPGYREGEAAGYARAKQDLQAELSTALSKQRELFGEQLMCCIATNGGMRALVECYCHDPEFLAAYDAYIADPFIEGYAWR